MANPTVTVTLDHDHPNLPEILRLAGVATDVAPTERLAVLDRLLAADLNDGEVLFLRTIATAAPEVATYDDLLSKLGSPEKLGNVTSSMFRRWKSRGGVDESAPWVDVPHQGRAMSASDAAIVLARLDAPAGAA
jgi:hypothetical protein